MSLNNKPVQFKVATPQAYTNRTKGPDDAGTFYLVESTMDSTKARLYLGDILLIELYDKDETANTVVQRTNEGNIKIKEGLEASNYEMKYDNEAKAVKFIFK